jgi:hypothetical protein
MIADEVHLIGTPYGMTLVVKINEISVGQASGDRY